jgi:hypothetical protein
MTLCPIALAAGCNKCPIVSACPLKGVIGDYKKPEDAVKAQEAGKPGGDKPA